MTRRDRRVSLRRAMKRRRGSDAPAAVGEESDPSIQLPSLPDDILARVFSIVEREAGAKYLAALSCVCKAWNVAFAQSAAWRVLLEQHQRAPRHPRRSWRDLYFAQLRKDAANVAQRHETMLLRLVHGGKNLGPMRRDSPKGLRRELLALGRDLDVDYAFASVRGRTLLGLCAAMGRLACAKELLRRWRPRCNVFDADGFTPLMEAAFRGNEHMAHEIMLARPDGDDASVTSSVTRPTSNDDAEARRGRNAPLDAPDEPFRGERSVNGCTRKLSAIEWATFRGNVRLAGLIEAREAGAAYDAEPRTRTNVTPWTV